MGSKKGKEKMTRICALCGSLTEGRHHLIPKKYNGYDQPIQKLCTSCHKRIHGALTESINNIQNVEHNQQVMIGNTTLTQTTGSIFHNNEQQNLTGSTPILGCKLVNSATNSENYFEATLQGGSVITFIGSPAGEIYYSVLYKTDND